MTGQRSRFDFLCLVLSWKWVKLGKLVLFLYFILLNVTWPSSLSFCLFSPSMEWHCLCKSHDPNRVFYTEANWFSPRQQPDLCFCPRRISRYLEESAGSAPPPSCSLLSWARSVPTRAAVEDSHLSSLSLSVLPWRLAFPSDG